MREIYRAHQHNGRRDAQDITVIPYFRADSATRFASARMSRHGVPPTTHYHVQRGVERLRSLKSPRLSFHAAYKTFPSSAIYQVKCLCLVREIRSHCLHVFY